MKQKHITICLLIAGILVLGGCGKMTDKTDVDKPNKEKIESTQSEKSSMQTKHFLFSDEVFDGYEVYNVEISYVFTEEETDDIYIESGYVFDENNEYRHALITRKIDGKDVYYVKNEGAQYAGHYVDKDNNEFYIVDGIADGNKFIPVVMIQDEYNKFIEDKKLDNIFPFEFPFY